MPCINVRCIIELMSNKVKTVSNVYSKVFSSFALSLQQTEQTLGTFKMFT